MLQIRDVMTRDVFTIPHSLGIAQAAWTLVHRGIGGAPVRDDQGQIVGVISKGDLVDLAASGRNEQDTRTVRDVMTPAIVSVEEDDSLLDAIQLMVGHGIHRVVVLDDAGRASGIVTALDVLRSLITPRKVHDNDRVRELDDDLESDEDHASAP